MHAKRIYISGPYEKDAAENAEKACFIANELADMGHVPFVPHLFYVWDRLHPRSKDEWLRIHLAWIERCDALIVTPNQSEWSRSEIFHAKRHGKEIYHYPEDLEKIGRVGQTAA